MDIDKIVKNLIYEIEGEVDRIMNFSSDNDNQIDYDVENNQIKIKNNDEVIIIITIDKE